MLGRIARTKLIDIPHSESLPFTGLWVDARWHTNHAFQVTEVGSITAADVEIQVRLSSIGDDPTVIGNTDTTGLTVPAAGSGDSLLEVSNEVYHQVRAVVNSPITGTGQLTVIYTGS